MDCVALRKAQGGVPPRFARRPLPEREAPRFLRPLPPKIGVRRFKPLSPWERGWGEGSGPGDLRSARHLQHPPGDSPCGKSERKSHPHPPRFARRPLPEGEAQGPRASAATGSRRRPLKPLSPWERGWGEGSGPGDLRSARHLQHLPGDSPCGKSERKSPPSPAALRASASPGGRGVRALEPSGFRASAWRRGAGFSRPLPRKAPWICALFFPGGEAHAPDAESPPSLATPPTADPGRKTLHQRLTGCDSSASHRR